VSWWAQLISIVLLLAGIDELESQNHVRHEIRSRSA